VPVLVARGCPQGMILDSRGTVQARLGKDAFMTHFFRSFENGTGEFDFHFFGHGQLWGDSTLDTSKGPFRGPRYSCVIKWTKEFLCQQGKTVFKPVGDRGPWTGKRMSAT